jgi:hypothetical protein
MLLFSLVAVTVSVAQAKTESINVEPTKDFVRTLQLAGGDQVSVTFKVLGPAPGALHFSTVLTNGTTIDYGAKNEGSIIFSTDVEGECQLRFVNDGSSDSQLLTLDYNVEHFVLGIPMLLFILLAVAVLMVFVIAGYIAMGKYA